MRFNFGKLVVLISFALLSACAEKIHWQEEALLSSNQKITVDRTVKFSFAELGKTRPTTYEISATDPITNNKINWKGSFGLAPIMLDFKNGNAFIVAKPSMCDAKIKQFSIKGFPYIFMRRSESSNWETVSPDQFPTEFRYSNLSASYNYDRINKGNYQSAEQISEGNKHTEKSSDGFFQVLIPRTPEEWNYKYNHYCPVNSRIKLTG